MTSTRTDSLTRHSLNSCWVTEKLPYVPKSLLSNSYEELFEEFIEYFEEEMEEIGGDSLKKEVEVMERLVEN